MEELELLPLVLLVAIVAAAIIGALCFRAGLWTGKHKKP